MEIENRFCVEFSGLFVVVVLQEQGELEREEREGRKKREKKGRKETEKNESKKVEKLKS